MDNYELQSDEKVLKENNVTQTKEEGVMCEVEIIEESNNLGSKQKKLFKGVGKALCNTVHKGVEVAGKMANKTAECSKIVLQEVKKDGIAVYNEAKHCIKETADFVVKMTEPERLNAMANLGNSVANIIDSKAKLDDK